MKVLFVYPDISELFSKTFHYGLGYMSSHLERAGYETQLIHLTAETPKAKFQMMVADSRSDLVAFTATTHQYPFVERYAQWIKDFSNLPIICGGIHATLAPEDAIKCKAIDMLCVGEGEITLLELVEHLEAGRDYSSLRGLWVKREDGSVRKNPVRPLVQDLDSLAFPNRDFDTRIVVNREADMLAGRGCPYKCTYCCNHSLVNLYKGLGKFVRWRKVDTVLDEVQRVIGRFDVDSVNFHDDTLTLKREWTLEFTEKWAKRFPGLEFSCNGHPNTLKPEILEALKAGNCGMVRIGVESGSERVRREVLKRSLSDEKLQEVFDYARKLGLTTSAFNMIGIPGETKEEMESTLELNKQLKPSQAVLSVFYPYPLTDLHKECDDKGLLKDSIKSNHLDASSALKFDEARHKQISNLYHRFKNHYYAVTVKRRSPRLEKLYRILEVVIGRSRARLTWIRARWIGFRIREVKLFLTKLRNQKVFS